MLIVERSSANPHIMKIAQVAPLFEAVPPKLYGGTERVIHYLTEKLVDMGHDVTLFASGDSQTSARLIPGSKQALRLDPTCIDSFSYHVVQLDDVISSYHSFDIIHFHTDYFHFPFTNRIPAHYLTTLHGRLDIPDLQIVFNRFNTQPVVSISDSQRMPLPQAFWIGTVYHGLPDDLLPPGTGDGNYLAFIGRISPEKGIEKAIEIAIANGKHLKVAAKIDNVDREYYETQVKHLMDDPLIEYIGEINEEQKVSFLGNAEALLFPINWSEPFGIVLIEAMSCGTPIIAFNQGSVPEVVDDGVTGFIVNNSDEAIAAVNRLNILSRTAIRKVFEEKFTSTRMAEDYVRLYEWLIESNPSTRESPADMDYHQ
jgi:glycosyltransferase involved in cell wall biosynthesis